MNFIKGGIAVRIDYYSDEDLNFLKNYFNLELYDSMNNSLLLKDKNLSSNFKNIHEELLKCTNNMANSVLNSDSYVLNASYDELIFNSIFISKDHKKYYYEFYKNNKFDTLMKYESFKNIKFRIYIIPLIWDISDINIEDNYFLITLINKLIRKGLNNILKDTLWFTITK